MNFQWIFVTWIVIEKMPKKIDLCGPPQILPSENLPSSSDIIRYKKYLDTVQDHNLIDIGRLKLYKITIMRALS